MSSSSAAFKDLGDVVLEEYGSAVFRACYHRGYGENENLDERIVGQLNLHRQLHNNVEDCNREH